MARDAGSGCPTTLHVQPLTARMRRLEFEHQPHGQLTAGTMASCRTSLDMPLLLALRIEVFEVAHVKTTGNSRKMHILCNPIPATLSLLMLVKLELRQPQRVLWQRKINPGAATELGQTIDQ